MKAQSPHQKTFLQSLTLEELAERLLPVSAPTRRSLSDEERETQRRKRARYRARQIFQWVYQRFVLDWDQMTDLSRDLREWLKENIEIYRLSVQSAQTSFDGTRKYLWGLEDGKTIESVIIPSALQEKSSIDLHDAHTRDIQTVTPSRYSGESIYGQEPSRDTRSEDETKWKRLTACISSQVGCAMACRFCLTGKMGLERQLQAHEIVTQVHELRKLAPITNIVFMGMGEPLHNLENVIQACKILLEQDGLNFSKRKVTVSTSGLVPAIDRLGQEVDVSLAISLNASEDEQRESIMPVNKRWNLRELMAACRRYPLGSHRRITFEYVLLKGINDAPVDAKRVVELIRGIPCKVNLIPFNEHSASEYKRPSDQKVREFQKVLMEHKITTTVRISRGRDILAACGQLKSLFPKRPLPLEAKPIPANVERHVR